MPPKRKRGKQEVVEESSSSSGSGSDSGSDSSDSDSSSEEEEEEEQKGARRKNPRGKAGSKSKSKSGSPPKRRKAVDDLLSQVDDLKAKKGSFQSLDEKTRKDIVHAGVRYALFLNANGEMLACNGKWNSAVKRGLCSGSNEQIIEQMNIYFNNVMGLQLKDVTESGTVEEALTQSKKAVRPQKKYVLVQMDDDPASIQKINELCVESTANATRGMVMTILGLILLHNGRISERTLWEHLGSLGAGQEQHNHEYFGDMKSFINKIIKEGYIIREKDDVQMTQTQGEAKFVFRMGPRSRAETSNSRVYAFIMTAMGGQPDDRVAAQFDVDDRDVKERANQIVQQSQAERGNGKKRGRPSQAQKMSN